MLRYALDAMKSDPEDPVDLTDEEFREMLCILKTVTDCLHDAKKTR